MTERIRENINNPEILERLYQDDKKAFKTGFEKIYPEIENTDMARFWKPRLDYSKSPFKTGSIIFSDLVILLAVCLITAFLIKIPDLFHIKYTNSVFYEKNAAIIVFFGLTLFSILIDKAYRQKWLLIVALSFLIPLIYVNLLPSNIKSDSVNLAYIHLPLLM